MYFVMDPPIESDMGPGYCLVGELVYTISHPGVVPSLFDGREDVSQWLAGAGSSSKFVNILSAVLWPAITVWVNSEGLSVLLTFVSQFQILIVCYTITMSLATNTDCSAQEVCSVADTLSTGFLSLSAVTLVRLHGNYNYSETLHNKDKLDTFWVE